MGVPVVCTLHYNFHSFSRISSCSLFFSFLRYLTGRQNTCSVITTVLEHWSVLDYYRSSKSAHSVKQWPQKNKPEQVDRAYAVMPEVADDDHDRISQ